EVLTEPGALGDAADPERLLLESLRSSVSATVVAVVTDDGRDTPTTEVVTASDATTGDVRRGRAAAIRRLHRRDRGQMGALALKGGQVWSADVRDAAGTVSCALVVARPGEQRWTADEHAAMEGFHRLLATTRTVGPQAQEAGRRRRLDELVTNVAVHLMSA